MDFEFSRILSISRILIKYPKIWTILEKKRIYPVEHWRKKKKKNSRTRVTSIIRRRNDPWYPFKIAIGHKLIEKQSIAPGTKDIDPHRPNANWRDPQCISTIHTELLCHETGVVGIVRVTTVQRGNIVLNLYGNSWMIIVARWCPYAAALLLLILLYVFVILFLEDTRSRERLYRMNILRCY